MSYLCEMHAHTCEVSSCGRIAAKELARMYKEKGYNGVIITDHLFKGYVDKFAGDWDAAVTDYIKGYQAAKAEGDKLGLDVYFGIELRFDEYLNDYLVYGADETFLREHPFLTKLKLKEFWQAIQGTKLRIVQAHPFRTGITVVKPHLLHGMEIYNGNVHHDNRNDITRLWAEKYNLTGISGSDFHEMDNFARGGIVLENRPGSYAELLETIFKKRAFRLVTTD